MWHLIYLTLCLKICLGELRVPRARQDAETRNLSKPLQRHQVYKGLLHIIPLFSSCIRILHLRTALNILWDWGYVAHLKNIHNLQVVTYISDYFLLSGHHQSGWEDQIGRMIQSQLMNSISPTALCMGMNYQEVKFLPLAHFPSGRILL